MLCEIRVLLGSVLRTPLSFFARQNEVLQVADDLNAFKMFFLDISNAVAVADMEKTRKTVHR